MSERGQVPLPSTRQGPHLALKKFQQQVGWGARLPSTHCCWKLVGVPLHVDFQLWRPPVLVPNKTRLSLRYSSKVDPGSFGRLTFLFSWLKN